MLFDLSDNCINNINHSFNILALVLLVLFPVNCNSCELDGRATIGNLFLNAFHTIHFLYFMCHVYEFKSLAIMKHKSNNGSVFLSIIHVILLLLCMYLIHDTHATQALLYFITLVYSCMHFIFHVFLDTKKTITHTLTGLPLDFTV